MNSNDWKTVSAPAPRFGRGAATAAPVAPSPSANSYRPAFGRAAASAGSQAPNAFSRAPPTERQLMRQADSNRMAEEQRRKQEAEVVAARKEADALNFASQAAYPALGGAAAAAPTKPKTALNYKRTVEEMVVREKEREAAEAVEEAANWWDAAEPQKRAPLQNRYIRQRVMDELDDDHLSVEEDDSDNEDTGEFNADLASNRRRGDKGVW